MRGVGLALGVEFTKNRETREPYHAFCQGTFVLLVFVFQILTITTEFLRRYRDNGIITGSDGEFQNVVKMRPPLIVQREQVDRALTQFEKTLKEMRDFKP